MLRPSFILVLKPSLPFLWNSSITNQVAALSPDSFTFSHQGHPPSLAAWSWVAVDLLLPPYPQLELLQGLMCTRTLSLYAILLPVNDNHNRKEERRRGGEGEEEEEEGSKFLPNSYHMSNFLHIFVPKTISIGYIIIPILQRRPVRFGR